MNETLEGLLIPEKQAFDLALWSGLLVLLAISGLILWRWYQYRKKLATIAQKRLNALKNKVLHNPQDSRAIAQELANILCQGLNVNRLDQYQPIQRDDWKNFHEKLNIACYANSSTEINGLLIDAKKWLSKV